MSAGGLRFGLYEICKEPNCDVWGVERVEGEWPFFAESSKKDTIALMLSLVLRRSGRYSVCNSSHKAMWCLS